ncbi:MAG TPA: hypothetical protein G4O05_09770 [Caldilineae bacterium]|nr:hypothetical protein [Caldilineae bacterium]
MNAEKLAPIHPGEVPASPQFWLGLQMDDDLDIAMDKLGDAIEWDVESFLPETP